MSRKIKVLVLGKTGMLGSMVEQYFKSGARFEVKGTTRKEFEAEEFLVDPNQFNWITKFDYIINCVGIIKPYCQDDDAQGVRRAIQVNAWFPHRLSQILADSPTRVIQIATDCVFSGKKGPHDESSVHDPLDVYGKTKSLGEVFHDEKFLNIRCSIIGPERKGKLSLLEWFLAQPNGASLNGFTHHQWNGVTTLQFAQLCEQLINNDTFIRVRRSHHTFHFVPNQSVNKYQLLGLFAQVFNKPVKIKAVADVGPAVDRRLASRYDTSLNPKNKLPMKQALLSLQPVLEAYYARG